MPAGPFTRVYTDQQKQAIRHAIAAEVPVTEIVNRAERGALELENEPLDPFAVKRSTVYDLARRYRLQRRKVEDRLTLADPSDTVESMRRRLINLISGRVDYLERQKSKNPLPVEELRGLSTCLRELARIPARDRPAPDPDPSTTSRAGQLGETRSEMARSILQTGTGINVYTDPEPDSTGDHAATQPTQDDGQRGSAEAPQSALVGTVISQ